MWGDMAQDLSQSLIKFTHEKVIKYPHHRVR